MGVQSNFTFVIPGISKTLSHSDNIYIDVFFFDFVKNEKKKLNHKNAHLDTPIFFFCYHL